MTTAVPGDQSETAGDVNPAFSKATDITGTIHALGTTPSDTGPLDPVGGEHSESVEPVSTSSTRFVVLDPELALS